MSDQSYERFCAIELNKANIHLEMSGDLKTLAYVLWTYREFLVYSKIKDFIKGRRYEIEARLDHQTER